jgi:hypothetical protein
MKFILPVPMLVLFYVASTTVPTMQAHGGLIGWVHFGTPPNTTSPTTNVTVPEKCKLRFNCPTPTTNSTGGRLLQDDKKN